MITALGFADDIILIADTPSKLKAKIEVSEKWSKRIGMKFNVDKCKVLALNVGQKGLSFEINGESIKLVSKTKYLGVLLSRSRLTSLYGKHIAEVIEKAEARANVIRHKGFHSDGLRPETTVRMYKILVRPMIEYAAQVISYKHYYFKERKCARLEDPTEMIKKLETLQNKILKKLVQCPKSTPPAMVRHKTGTIPIAGRIDMLNLRYFWKLHHSGEGNIATKVYTKLRNTFLQSNIGYAHEIFNLCCKFGEMDLWHGICPVKVNPLARIKRIVEEYYLKKDQKVAQEADSVYGTLTLFHEKKYKLDRRLKGIGRFQTTEHRSVFLYAFLDNCNYDRECGHCGMKVKDITKHGMEDCKGVEQERKIYCTMMKLYDAPTTINLRHKTEVFKLAFTKKCFLKVFCRFLQKIWSRIKEEEEGMFSCKEFLDVID